jgi:hypothetical protein
MADFKSKNRELADMIDPGTQLVKSIGLMISTLQEDMEAKRNSDSEIAKLILQSQQQETARTEKLRKELQDQIAKLES